MLHAQLNGASVFAWHATDKTLPYTCWECNEAVILRKGQKNIHHFAHIKDSNCVANDGETYEHEATKQAVYQALIDQGCVAAMEVNLMSLGCARRADIVFQHPKGQMVAIEIQHSNINEEIILLRSRDYSSLNMPVIWVIPDGEDTKFNSMAQTFHTMHNGVVWVSGPDNLGKLCPVRLHKRTKWVDQKDFHVRGGHRVAVGGYEKSLKRKDADWGRVEYYPWELEYKEPKADLFKGISTGQLAWKDRWFA